MGWEKGEILRSNPHPTGFQTGNNRKMTKGRYVMATKVQSISIFDDFWNFMGYRYIYHR